MKKNDNVERKQNSIHHFYLQFHVLGKQKLLYNKPQYSTAFCTMWWFKGREYTTNEEEHLSFSIAVATFVETKETDERTSRKFTVLPCLVKSESMKENNFTADKERKRPTAGNRDVARGLDGRKWKFKSSLNEASNPLPPLSLSLSLFLLENIRIFKGSIFSRTREREPG